MTEKNVAQNYKKHQKYIQTRKQVNDTPTSLRVASIRGDSE